MSSSSKYTLSEWMKAANRRLELLERIIEEGNRGFSAMTGIYHWSIPWELKKEIENELSIQQEE